MAADRTHHEAFLELVQRSRRGRLKIYLGFAAGVGKTYHMLEEAHALRARGTDVVLGFVETHGRAETAALLEGLEVVPRRRFEYRGVTLEEMDLDGVLARRPEVAIVDEVAHTNVPGSKNRKRWEDVLDILGAGINVICAFNIQHLASLNDLVERATGVEVQETVPDSFLQQADQVVNLDLAVEDLLDRLRAGKIYEPSEITQALRNFFKEYNLASLRELSLREVAESLDRSLVARAAREEPERRISSGRLLVAVSSHSPRALTLLRRGSRIAGRLNTDWYVVTVETPKEAPHRIDAEAQRHLLATIKNAKELGAEVVRLHGRDPVASILDFARSHEVQHIVIGRSHQPWWRGVGRRGFVERMVREGHDFDVLIVGLEEE